MKGKTISHYQILEKIGEGGMGVVYKAEDTKLKRIVALKLLSPQTMKSEEERNRFIREAQTGAALDHPNICTVYEIDESDKQLFITMAYLEGLDLKQRLKSGPIPIKEVLDISIEIANGLKEAHSKKIIHRDIKSSNVILTKTGRAVALIIIATAATRDKTNKFELVGRSFTIRAQ